MNARKPLPRLPWEFVSRLSDQLRSSEQEEMYQAQHLSSFWLALRRRAKGWSDDAIIEQTGLPRDALVCLEAGVAKIDLGTEVQWSALCSLLADEEYDEDYVMAVMLIALGLYDVEDAALVEQVAADIEEWKNTYDDWVTLPSFLGIPIKREGYRNLSVGNNLSRHMLVMGTTGSGKTQSVLVFIRELFRTAGRVGPLEEVKIVLSPPQTTDIRGDDVDIVHFTGHGTVTDDILYLDLEDRDGRRTRVRGDLFFGQIKQAAPSLHLAVLQSCEITTPHSPWDEEGVLIRKALADVGIPAVVALRDTVDKQLVPTVMLSFYTELSQGKSVEQALAAARRELPTREQWGELIWYTTKVDERQSHLLAEEQARSMTENESLERSRRLGSLVAELRGRRRWSRSDVAVRLYDELDAGMQFSAVVTETWLQQIEEGGKTSVTREVVDLLSRVLQCTDEEYLDLLRYTGTHGADDIEVPLMSTLGAVFAEAMDNLIQSMPQSPTAAKGHEELLLDVLENVIEKRRSRIHEASTAPDTGPRGLAPPSTRRPSRQRNRRN